MMRLESKPAANLGLYIAAIALGLLIMWLARDFSHAGTNVKAGFLLGCMLFGLGAIALVVAESRTVELDERRRMIILAVSRRVGGNRRIEIPFSDIRGISIGLQGNRTDGSRYYDLVVRLGSGKEICLFGGCVFEGRMSREWIANLRARFEEAVGLGRG
jgi:hypothetical protein